jgi:hypothetical protein
VLRLCATVTRRDGDAAFLRYTSSLGALHLDVRPALCRARAIALGGAASAERGTGIGGGLLGVHVKVADEIE